MNCHWNKNTCSVLVNAVISVFLQQLTCAGNFWIRGGYEIKNKFDIIIITSLHFTFQSRYLKAKSDEPQEGHTQHTWMEWKVLIGVVLCQVWLIRCGTRSLRIDSDDKMSNVIKFSASQDIMSPWPVRPKTGWKWGRLQKRARQREITGETHFLS